MAIREIRVVGDRVLTKKCRPVEKMTPRISELIDDMFDTMYEANGVGLAAPQVGILKENRSHGCGWNPTSSDQSGNPGDFRKSDRSRGMLKAFRENTGTVTRPN